MARKIEDEIPDEVFQSAALLNTSPSVYIEGKPICAKSHLKEDNFLLRFKRRLIQRRINKLEKRNEQYDKWMIKVMLFKIENEKRIKEYKRILE